MPAPSNDGVKCKDMNRFVVPQFIDVEDKIFGPITVRQFLICTIGGLLIFLSFKLADFSLFVFETFIIGGMTIVMAFVRVNGKNFHYFLLDLLNFIFKTTKIAIWQKKEIISLTQKGKKEVLKKEEYIFKPKGLPRTKLSELSLIVDTGGSYTGENSLAETKLSDTGDVRDNIIGKTKKFKNDSF